MPKTGKTSFDRRKFLAATSATAGSLLVAGCMGGDDDDNGGSGGNGGGSGTLDFIIPVSEGGGADRSVREIQSYFEDEIGQNMAVEYQPGAGQRIAIEQMVGAPADGNTVLFGNIPWYAFLQLLDDEFQPLEDLTPIGNTVLEPGLIRIHEDEDRFSNLEELVQYGIDNPGELTYSTSGPFNRNVLGTLLIQEATGAEFSLVPYDGGSGARTALLQQEVDFTHASVYNSLGIADGSTCIGVHSETNEWPDLTDDAPTVNDALGTDISNEAAAGRYAWWVQSEVKDEHPDRYDALVSALEAAATNEEYLNDLSSLDTPEDGKVRYLSPEDTMERNEEAFSLAEEYIDVMEGSVQE